MQNKYIFTHVFEQVAQDSIKNGIVYVCDNEKLFQLKCPCGCGETITGQLFPCERPRWTIVGNSITPSINRTTGCKSHFSITNGIVYANEFYGHKKSHFQNPTSPQPSP